MLLLLLGSLSFWWHNMRSFKIFVCTIWFELWHFFCVIFLPRYRSFRFWCHQPLIPALPLFASSDTVLSDSSRSSRTRVTYLLIYSLSPVFETYLTVSAWLWLFKKPTQNFLMLLFFDVGIEESRAAVWQLFHSLTATTNYKWIRRRRIALRKLKGPLINWVKGSSIRDFPFSGESGGAVFHI